MPVVVFLIIGALLLVLQTSLIPMLPAWLGKPEFLFLLIVFIPSRMGVIPGASVAFLLGILSDVYSGIYLGLFPITYLLIFFILKGIYRFVAVNETFYQAPIVAVTYLLTCGGIFIAAMLLGDGNQPQWTWDAVLVRTLLVAILTMPFFSLFDLCWEKSAVHQPRWRLFKRKKRENRFRS